MYPNLRVELWKAGIRQNKLAKMLAMDETLVSRIVNGYRQPSPEFRKRLSVLLNSDEAWLFAAEVPAGSEQRNAKTAGQET